VYHEGKLAGIDERNLAAKAESVCSETLRSSFPEIFGAGS
jgi:hypothetical protein